MRNAHVDCRNHCKSIGNQWKAAAARHIRNVFARGTWKQKRQLPRPPQRHWAGKGRGVVFILSIAKLSIPPCGLLSPQPEGGQNKILSDIGISPPVAMLLLPLWGGHALRTGISEKVQKKQKNTFLARCAAFWKRRASSRRFSISCFKALKRFPPKRIPPSKKARKA